MKAFASTAVVLYSAAAICTTLLACSTNGKDAFPTAQPETVSSAAKSSSYVVASRPGQMPEDNDNIIYIKMYNLYLSAFSN